jgi:hypothetical protein
LTTTAICRRAEVRKIEPLIEISLAITLYNDGNDSPERLLRALEIELVGDAIPLSRLGTSARFDG